MSKPAYARWRLADDTRVFHYNEDNNTCLSTVAFDNRVGAGGKDIEFFTDGKQVEAKLLDDTYTDDVRTIAATTLHDTPETFEKWARMVVAMYGGPS